MCSSDLRVAGLWGAFSAGVSFEHIHYLQGMFDEETNIANDTNLFAGYRWAPNPGLRISPSAVVTMRADETLAVQRYSFSGRFDIEQRLTQQWWFLASSRFRRLDYVGRESGRREARLAFVTGLKYVVTDSMSARMLAGWENRDSTVSSRIASRFTIGASLDFDIDFSRIGLPAGR